MLHPGPRIEGNRLTFWIAGPWTPLTVAIWALPWVGLAGFAVALFSGLARGDDALMTVFVAMAGTWVIFLVATIGADFLGWFAVYEARFDLEARTFELVDRRTLRVERSERFDPNKVHPTI